jgi:predicted GNAT family acetyltransferase
MDATDETRLDNPIHAALSGPHAALAQRSGAALRYPAAIAPFLALPAAATDADWQDARALVATGTMVGTMRLALAVPPPWEARRSFPVVQMVCEEVAGAVAPEIVALGSADAGEMAALVAATNPGPFFPRTIELGDYYGVRRNERLIAMAGERMHLDGWTEVSAVCTDAAARGQGLGSALVRAVLHGIGRRSERAFLHAASSNTPAIRVYQALGFRTRRELTVTVLSPGS